MVLHILTKLLLKWMILELSIVDWPWLKISFVDLDASYKCRLNLGGNPKLSEIKEPVLLLGF